MAARAANTARQLGAVPWFLGNIGIKVLLSARLGGLVRRITGRQLEWPY